MDTDTVSVFVGVHLWLLYSLRVLRAVVIFQCIARHAPYGVQRSSIDAILARSSEAIRDAVHYLAGFGIIVRQQGGKLPKWADYEPHGANYRAAEVVALRA